MRKLEWDNMGVKVDGRQLHHLRFADDIVLITPSISQTEAEADRIRRNMWMHRSSAEDHVTWLATKDHVHAERMGLGCPIHAQRNEHIRMHQLRLFGSGTKHNERPGPRAGQEETSSLGSVQEHRGCSKEDQEHPAPCSPLQHHRTSCTDLCFGNLGISQAGRKRSERH
ncbi:hypothetical protein RB195_005949 [Necator americanus]|uniref:Reverse transcriptase domain-containing protein n=1 Tax=Necator americanus TaxID=51031 RepID=A0ABR1BS52_NECAM